MAQSTGHAGVPIRQRKAGGIVVKNSRGPGGDRVASGACGRRRWEPGRNVVRNIAANRGGALEGSRMASVTICRAERVVVADVARCARRGGRRHVRSGQRKSGRAVIERRRGPARRVVAGGAIHRRECRPGCGVYGIVGALPGGQMALRIAAVGRGDRQRVIIVDVTLRALQIRMALRQIESRSAVVGEGSTSPSNGGCIVARRAILDREPSRVSGVRWVRGLLPRRQMASRIPAIVLCDTGQIIIVADVA